MICGLYIYNKNCLAANSNVEEYVKTGNVPSVTIVASSQHLHFNASKGKIMK